MRLLEHLDGLGEQIGRVGAIVAGDGLAEARLAAQIQVDVTYAGHELFDSELDLVQVHGAQLFALLLAHQQDQKVVEHGRHSIDEHIVAFLRNNKMRDNINPPTQNTLNEKTLSYKRHILFMVFLKLIFRISVSM